MTKQQQRAYGQVRAAFKKGILKRPAICSRCKKNPGPTADGRTKIHAHHRDYSKPLDVEWLCAKCHRADTPLPEIVGGCSYGERNGQAKLNRKMVRLILSSSESNCALGRKLGVNNTTVSRVRRKVHWLSPAEVKATGGGKSSAAEAEGRKS